MGRSRRYARIIAPPKKLISFRCLRCLGTPGFDPGSLASQTSLLTNCNMFPDEMRERARQALSCHAQNMLGGIDPRTRQQQEEDATSGIYCFSTLATAIILSFSTSLTLGLPCSSPRACSYASMRDQPARSTIDA